MAPGCTVHGGNVMLTAYANGRSVASGRFYLSERSARLAQQSGHFALFGSRGGRCADAKRLGRRPLDGLA